MLHLARYEDEHVGELEVGDVEFARDIEVDDKEGRGAALEQVAETLKFGAFADAAMAGEKFVLGLSDVGATEGAGEVRSDAAVGAASLVALGVAVITGGERFVGTAGAVEACEGVFGHRLLEQCVVWSQRRGLSAYV